MSVTATAQKTTARDARHHGVPMEIRAPTPELPATPGVPIIESLWRYQLDLSQQSVLFLDTLRERANQMLHHEQAGFATGARLRLSSLRASGLLRAGSDSPARALNRQGE